MAYKETEHALARAEVLRGKYGHEGRGLVHLLGLGVEVGLG